MNNSVSVIEKVGSMVKAGDMSAFEGMLASAICVSPFDGDKSKLKAYYQKHPSRYVDDLGKLKDNLPQYGGNKPLNNRGYDSWRTRKRRTRRNGRRN